VDEYSAIAAIESGEMVNDAGAGSRPESAAVTAAAE